MIVPCIVCGCELKETAPGHSTNQPHHGVCATIPGNYGSTVFDPFDGTYLEVNICDPCLVAAGTAGRVLSGRRRLPVSMGGFRVGHQDVDVPLVQWHEGLPGYDQDEIVLDEDEDLSLLPSSVHINKEALSSAQLLLAAEEAG